jgi:uncharacterized membrane protein (GlpM family)
MANTVLEVSVKAVAGGTLVLAFAALAETLTPKRFAGVFSAAPSVALASIIVTAVFSGLPDVQTNSHGMVIGAAAFTVYCLLVVPLIKRWGPARGSATALLAWLMAATVGYLVWS